LTCPLRRHTYLQSNLYIAVTALMQDANLVHDLDGRPLPSGNVLNQTHQHALTFFGINYERRYS